MQFQLGEFRISIVSGGRFRLDGGSMFGVVPRPLWQKVAPPDDANRIELDTNCVFVDTGTHRVLIDTGFGPRLSEKEKEHNAVPIEPSLIDNLRSIGVEPEQIDFVVLSHLHFDHVGGATTVDEAGAVRLAFPRARHVAQGLEWNDATSTLPEIAGTYLDRDIRPLVEAGVDLRVEGNAEIVPGITVQRTGAHTPGHQIVRIESGGQTAIFLGDLCPTVNHLRTFWTMGYDQFPRETRRLKPLMLGECADRGIVVLFDHEPVAKAVRLARDARKEFSANRLEFAQGR